ncbi:MAG TPA: hypothetical protein VLQ65_01100 [Saliniramus sp.]|nr:hypothetical protein [Saliniramus sp.]
MVGVAIALLVAPSPVSAGETIFPPGYSVGLTPPEGMLPAGDFVGFEDKSAGAAITLYDLPAEAFDRISQDFTIESLVQQGVREPERSEVTIEGAGSAFLITGEQQESGIALRKWILIAGTQERAALVVGEMLAGNPRYDDAAMREALLTLAFRDRPSPAERADLLPFRIGDKADFSFVDASMAYGVVLTEGDAIADPTQPIVIVAAIPGEIPAAEFRDAYARGSLLSLQGLGNFEIERAESFRQRNDDWHEIVAKATDPSGNALVVMQTMRFSRQGLFRMLATVRLEDREEVMPRFRRIVDSVEPR